MPLAASGCLILFRGLRCRVCIGRPAEGFRRHLDLDFHIGFAPFGRAVKGRYAVGKGHRQGNQRLQIDLAGSDQGNRAVIDIGIAEHRFDPQFPGLKADNVNGHRIDRHSDQNDGSSRAGEARQLQDRRGRAGTFKNDIGAPSVRRPGDRPGCGGVADVDRLDARIGADDVQLGLRRIGHENPGAAPGQGGQGGHHADGTGPQHQARVARLDARPQRGLHSDREGFDHGAFREGHVVWQAIGEGRRMNHMGRQAAVDRRRRPETHRRIDVVDPQLGCPGRGVGDPRLHADAIPDLQVADLAADLDHGAGRLVAQNHGFGHDERSDLAMRVVMHVRSADADGMHRDAHVGGRQILIQVDLAQRQLALAFQHQ